MSYRGLCGRMKCVICKKQVGYSVFLDIINGVICEKSHVHDIDLLKGAEQELRQSVAVAVLENSKLSAVAGGSLDVGNFCVAAHKGAVKHGFGI